MAKVVVLGGCGAVGSVAARTLCRLPYFSEVVIADLNGKRARELAAAFQSEKARAKKVDALDPAGLRRTIAGADVVLNCTGPFYKFVKPVLAAALDARVNYVDICDDYDVTIEILKLHSEAKKRGVHALIGMGSSPGATNLLAKFAADNLLDATDSIDIFHAHGGEPVEGLGVIGHRFHCMTGKIPMFLEGKLRWVGFFEPDGAALQEDFDFPVIGRVRLYPYPHPEQITLPRHVKCRRVTNKGTVLPAEYYDLIKEMARLGLTDTEPVTVHGRAVTPADFAMAYIVRERDRILKRTRFGSQRGCASVVVKGTKDGKRVAFRFHMASASQALGEGTGIPAAAGAILMQQGKIKGPGVLPPEACVNPLDFIALVPEVMKLDKKKEGGKGFGGVIVERVDEDGKVSKLDI